MRTILFVTPGLEYNGAGRQLTLLAAGLPRESFRVCVAILGVESPWAASLRAEGVAVEVLGRRRTFDVWPFLALRRLTQSLRPDVVHAWGAGALRAVVGTGSKPASQVLVSAALPRTRSPGRLDRWLLRRAEGVIAFGAAEAERYRRLGVRDERTTIVAPAVSVSTAEPARLPGVTDGARVLLGMGPIERPKGFREAVWAFDILLQLYDNLHLVLAGTGNDRPRVERFARQIGVTSHVHFPGAVSDPAPLLHRAEIVLVPSLHGGGVCAALEAMAAGRPVVASRCPDLAEVVVNGVTGFLVEPDNKSALARQVRRLLDDPELRRRCGEAGRKHAAEHFALARLVEAGARRYTGGPNLKR